MTHKMMILIEEVEIIAVRVGKRIEMIFDEVRKEEVRDDRDKTVTITAEVVIDGEAAATITTVIMIVTIVVDDRVKIDLREMVRHSFLC